jgi:Flp pilus assembly pilin Flp
MKLKKELMKFWNDEEGQSTTEYILILSVVVMVALKFKSTFGNLLEGQVQKLGGKIQGAIEDGGSP